MAGLVQIINRSSSDDLKEKNIEIGKEVRLKDLYVLNNYIQSVQHLPGIIEVDALDSFKMLSCCEYVESQDIQYTVIAVRRGIKEPPQ